MQLSNFEALDLWSAIRRQRRVIFALMLRNIKTRFFGSGVGYLFAIAWPMSHILILVVMYSLLRREPPYGESTVLFIATGVVPFLTFSYLARFMMLSVIRNRQLLAFPEVKVLDILFASAALEILAASCVTIVLMIMASVVGIDIMPLNIVQAAFAFGAAILLGLGFGLLNSVIALAIPGWFTGYSLINIVLWATAGIFFVPDTLPDTVRRAIAYQPVVQVVEWTRSAYYEGYGNLVLDRSYVIGVSLVTIFLGLVLERAMRGHLLAYK